MSKRRITFVLFASFAMAFVATSCRRNDEVQQTQDKDKKLSARVETSPLVAQTEKPMSRDERYKAEFERLAVSSNMTVRASASQVSALSTEIYKLPDKRDSLRLLDQFLETAISQNVSETNYYARQNWYRQLFYIARCSFGYSQLLRKESFESWDNLFRFFGKFTNEIVNVEKSLPVDCDKWSDSDWEKGSYVYKLKGDLEQDIRTMRCFHFPDLSEGLTEDQKADIHRRFDELQTYTLTPTNFPFGRKGEIDFSNLPVIDCPPVPRREMRSGHF